MAHGEDARSLLKGYSAAAGAEVTRAELTGEAIRLGRLLIELRPEPEVMGPEIMGSEIMELLSLMLLQESRRAARTSPTGELILLENQDRSLWNREQIAEGVALLEKALKSRRFGSYTLQAAIAAVHAEAESVAATDWRRIVALYDRLLRIQPSPVVQLNRAVAIAMRDGPEAGLAHIDAVLEQGELANYADSPGQAQSAVSVLAPIFGRIVHPWADNTSTAMPICRRVNWRLRSFQA